MRINNTMIQRNYLNGQCLKTWLIVHFRQYLDTFVWMSAWQ